MRTFILFSLPSYVQYLKSIFLFFFFFPKKLSFAISPSSGLIHRLLYESQTRTTEMIPIHIYETSSHNAQNKNKYISTLLLSIKQAHSFRQTRQSQGREGHFVTNHCDSNVIMHTLSKEHKRLGKFHLPIRTYPHLRDKPYLLWIVRRNYLKRMESGTPFFISESYIKM